ncbi:MAG TPA: D-alanyl-D-alanine carboxypeptidase family protein [Oscillospiraceae bacterium]|nr:D-alanyl-D-alanine carboxypeptidase family protein [Oscillospiraceae bacterium]HPF56847.1 D-alanyl-D-alanine carboxypeptidase family protein [Clostridiales bacterium]HPK35785.1 D-alanyl-D-alanine carboxypeptidase family protein [Oscillospiraceae bacterium]HPR75405.1 D-alanyl-D-alanine carboxypeptidase family protein [Oscillospiraceae bacterium]
MRKFKRAAAIFVMLLVLSGTFLFSASAEGVYAPNEEPQAEGVYIVNEDTDLVMYDKNGEERLYPASLTKIMSAIVILENVKDLDGTVGTMTNELLTMIQGTGSAVLNLAVGEEITMRQMLYAMLLASDGDAALLAAATTSGSVDAFVQQMNEKATQLGCINTHFTNPHGLHDDNHYSCAYDIYLMIKEAMKYPVFNEIVNSTRYTIPATNKHAARTIVTTNMMLSYNLGGSLYYEPVRGIKTGFTTPAGPCLASLAEKNGQRYIIVLLKSTLTSSDGSVDRYGAFKTTKTLYEWLFSTYALQTLLTETTVVKSIPVNYGDGVDEIGLVPSAEFVTMVPKNADISSIIVKFDDELKTKTVDAPVEAGTILGTAELLIGDKSLGTVQLVAATSVSRNELSYILAQIGNFFSSDIMIIIACVLAILIAGYIILNIVYNRRKKSRYSAPSKRSKRPRSRNRNIFR